MIERALRYEVTPAKALVFMKDIMFKRTRAKYFRKDMTEEFDKPVSFTEKKRRGQSDAKKQIEMADLMESMWH